MTTPTASEVNGRIARFMNQCFTSHPDYMHDANAASAAIEKYCREHNKVADLFFNGKVWVSQIGDNFFCAPDEQAEADEQIATAASLALFAVLGEGS